MFSVTCDKLSESHIQIESVGIRIMKNITQYT
jgi:hypothetical protein